MTRIERYKKMLNSPEVAEILDGAESKDKLNTLIGVISAFFCAEIDDLEERLSKK